MTLFKYIFAGIVSLFSVCIAKAAVIFEDKIYIQNAQDLDLLIQEYTDQSPQKFTEYEKLNLLEELKNRGLVGTLEQGRSSDTTGWQTKN